MIRKTKDNAVRRTATIVLALSVALAVGGAVAHYRPDVPHGQTTQALREGWNNTLSGEHG